MTPDYDRAATLAAEQIIARHITRLPIHPETVIQIMPNTVLVPYADVARVINVARDELIVMLDPAQDAVTYVMNLSDDRHYYVVAYNAKKDFQRLRFTLAHELGHRMMAHTGKKPEDVREAEADHFARHFLLPRAYVAMLLRRNIPLLDVNLHNVVGCTPQCIERMRHAPESHVAKKINRKIREQFVEFVDYLMDTHTLVMEPSENAHIVDLGHFMDGYED